MTDETTTNEGAAGGLARSAAVLVDLGLLIAFWAAGSAAAESFQPAMKLGWDDGCLRWLAPAYLVLTAAMGGGETLGQRLLGLRVLDLRYLPMNPSRLLARNLFFVATLPLAPVNGILVLLPRSGTLHDLITSTRVMVDPASSPLRRWAGVVLALPVAALAALMGNLILADHLELKSTLPAAVAKVPDRAAALAAVLRLEP